MLRRLAPLATLTALASLALSCGKAPAAGPAVTATAAAPGAAIADGGAPGPAATRYADPSAWLCLPGREDACAGDLSATVLHADGSRTIERSEASRDPKIDCFYVYPTVDVSPEPGNHEDFRDVSAIASATLAQAGRLRQACALYVPFYRQVTIGSYFHPDSLEPRLALAFSDVEAAFREYLARYNHGRPIVLVGHSQGGDMTVRLLQRFFDHDAELQARLVLGLPIGWEVFVPRGKTRGATFENLPLCTSPTEAGCVVTYRSYEAGSNPHGGDHAPHEGNVSVCVNPAAVGSDGLTSFSRSYLRLGGSAQRYLHLDGIETPFVEFDGFYQGQCADGPNGCGWSARRRS